MMKSALPLRINIPSAANMYHNKIEKVNQASKSIDRQSKR